MNPRDGKATWEIKVFSRDHLETAIGSPIVADDLVLGTCGYLGIGNHAVAVRPIAGTGRESDAGKAEELYRVEHGAPLTTTPLAVRELLLLCSDEGIVTCLDVATGKVHWQKRVGGTYYASPICAGKHLYCISADGKLVLLAAATKYQELSRIDLGEPSNATPAIARGKMFLRTESKLMVVASKLAR